MYYQIYQFTSSEYFLSIQQLKYWALYISIVYWQIKNSILRKAMILEILTQVLQSIIPHIYQMIDVCISIAVLTLPTEMFLFIPDNMKDIFPWTHDSDYLWIFDRRSGQTTDMFQLYEKYQYKHFQLYETSMSVILKPVKSCAKDCTQHYADN